MYNKDVKILFHMDNLKVNKYKLQDIKQYEDEIEYWKNIITKINYSVLFISE